MAEPGLTDDELKGLSPDPATLLDDVREAEVAVGVIRGLITMVGTRGVDRDAFLHAAGLSPEALDAPDGRLPYAKASQALDLALEMTQDELLGLHWAHALTERTFVPISHLVSHSATLAESFRLLARYYHLLTNRPSFELVAGSGTSVTLRYVSIAGESEAQRRFAGDMTIGSFFRFIYSFDPKATPGPVSFFHTPSSEAQRSAYQRFFCAEVRFGCDFTGMEFDRRLLHAASPQRDDEVRDALKQVVEQRLVRIDRDTRWAVRVREELARRGPKGSVDMESVARAMGVSPRTLRRRLAAEACTYDGVLEKTRRDAAMRLLQTPDASIQEVAFQLGFSSASAFHRAFKRWTGMTPTGYRERQLRARR